jgi:cytochrome c oxidase assembly protein subunit 15
MKITWLTRLSSLNLLLAFSVILLGAYTRLTDAGLGCPDWPGCYGQLIAPHTTQAIETANAAFPTMPVETAKAHTEMTHRYFAETLGILIVLFSLLTYWQRRAIKLPRWLPFTLTALVIFQGILGMWTVTLRLFPLVVLSHLLGGFCTLALLWLSWLSLRQKALPSFSDPFLFKLSVITLSLLILQISLGGWTSANAAALICPDFPRCQGNLWPSLDFKAAFDMTGEFMSTGGKTTVHWLHRLGAFITLLFGMILASHLWRQRLRTLSLSLACLFMFQVFLGISNILFAIPIPIAVAHNGTAALLLLLLIRIAFITRSPRFVA